MVGRVNIFEQRGRGLRDESGMAQAGFRYASGALQFGVAALQVLDRGAAIPIDGAAQAFAEIDDGLIAEQFGGE